MEFKFTQENLDKIKDILKKYPTKKAAVMPVLCLGQEQNGWVSKEVMVEVATVLEITEEEVFGVVTFYTMFYEKPVGQKHFQVCTNVSCMLKGGYDIYNQVKEKLGLENWGVSEDKRFSLEEVECMGSCGTAPMIAVNEDYYENITQEKVNEIIESLKSKN